MNCLRYVTRLLITLILVSGGVSSDSAPVDSQSASNTVTQPLGTESPNPATFVKQGVITGFGSIILDGQEFNTDTAEVIIDGDAGAHLDVLKAGMKVLLLASASDDSAPGVESVFYDVSLKGRVTSIDRNNQRLVVEGITVRYNEITHFFNTSEQRLRVGNHVEISGYHQANGDLLATYIEFENDEMASSLLLSGVLSDLNTNGQTFSIGTTLVDYSEATTAIALVEGRGVRIEGEVRDDRIFALRIGSLNSYDLLDFSDTTRAYYEVEGLVTGYDSVRRTISIDGRRFVLSEGAPDRTILVDDFVEVYIDGTSGEITRVELKNDRHTTDGRVKGPITAINTDIRTIEVYNRIYYFTDYTRFEDDHQQYFNFNSLNLNDFVEIAFAQRDGLAVIQRIELEDENEYYDEWELKGPVSGINAASRTLTVVGITISLDTNPVFVIGDQVVTGVTFINAAIAGQCPHAEVKGRYDAAGNFVARRVECENASRGDSDVDHGDRRDGYDDDDDDYDDRRSGYVEFESRVTSILEGNRFLLNQREVRIDETSRLEYRDRRVTVARFMALLRVGQRVEVEGYWVDNRYLFAVEAEIDDD